MLREFRDPGLEFRPKVWWHWMNGNISKDGIRKDLLWMQQAGIGGVQVFDIGLGVADAVEQRLPYMSDGWKDAFAYAAQLADSLGFEFAVTSGGGWSDTGGPWTTPEEAMKTLNWKEMTVQGGRRIRTRLPEPNVICGKYLNHSFFAEHKPEYDFYRDIAVIAVRIPETDLSLKELGAVISTSDGSDPALLTDGDINKVCLVAPGRDGYAWVQYAFPAPVTLRSFFSARKDDWNQKHDRHWEVSNDGVNFAVVPTVIPDSNVPFVVLDIPATTGRFFRFVSDIKGESLDNTELVPYTVTKVQNATEKAGFFTSPFLRDAYPTPDCPDATPLSDVLDISDMYRGGVLRWKAPEGRWRIYRFGYTIRGRRTNPASPEACGLEIDKLDPAVTSSYYHRHLDMLNEASGGKMGSTITHLMIDSFEAGCQTWTANMPAEFLSRRGYELTKWLPALAGDVIGSSEQTERFLQDWRCTLGEMLVDYHYNAVDPILKEYGLKRYTEFHESGRVFPVDGMEVKRNADIPMGAFWLQPDSLTLTRYKADIRESASIAHFYGQNLVAAESFTTEGLLRADDGTSIIWDAVPSRMKGAADIALASGLNTFVIHSSVHQPSDEKIPGVTLDYYGSWFQRHETWAHEAKSFTDYLARNSYLLRQGVFRADVAYFISETTNLTDRFNVEVPAVPEGYAFDYANPAMLASDRFAYKALMIDPEVRFMSIGALRSVMALADRGVIIAGSEPQTYLGLADNSAEFASLVQSIWHSGRANVCSFGELPRRLMAAGCMPDVDFGPEAHPQLSFVHRSLEDSELYFLVNSGHAQKGLCLSFNVVGRKPILLDAATGTSRELAYKAVAGRTSIVLDMNVRDAVFILFADKTDVAEFSLPERQASECVRIQGPWNVDLGSGVAFDADELYDLSTSTDPAVRYFSGTASYKTSCSIDSLEPGSEYLLNLGKVHSLARVFVNGVDCGLAWKDPFVLDVTSALRPGENQIEVRVTNGWFNRLLGDSVSEAAGSTATWTSPYKLKPDEVLHHSGLIGPVVIFRQ